MPVARTEDHPDAPGSPLIDWRGRVFVLLQFTVVGCVCNALALQLPGSMPFLVGNMAAVAIALRFGLRWSLPVAVLATGITGNPLWLLLALLECLLVARFAARGYGPFGLWWRTWLPLFPLVAWITLPRGADDPLLWSISIAVVLLTGATSIIGGLQLMRVTRSSRQMALQPMAMQLSIQLSILMAAPAIVAISLLLQWGHQQNLQRLAVLLDGKATQLAGETSAHLRLHREAVRQASTFAAGSGPEATIERVGESHPGFITMLVADAEGEIVVARRSGLGVVETGGNVADRDYFRAAMASGETVISNVFRGRGIGTDVIVAVAAPLPGPEGRPIGVLQGALGLAHVARGLRSELDAAGLRYAMVDAASQVVFSSLPDQQKLDIAGQYGSLAPGRLARPWWSTALLEAPEAHFDAQARHLVASVTDAETGWRAVVLQPLRPIERTESLLSLIAALLVLAILHGLRWLAVRFADRHSRGLAEIVARLRDLDLSGNTSVLAGGAFATSAEITELVQDFERTEQRLQDMHRSLRASAEDLASLNRELEARVEARTTELRVALARAEHLAAAKAGFLANMSHELRTPLSAILGYSEQGLREGATPFEVRRCLQTVVRNGRHLLEIVNDVLDASKIEAGELRVQVRPMAPLAVASEAVELLRQRAAEKSLELLLSAHWPLPAEVSADPLRLKQILLNLLGNAIKFTPAGFVAVHVAAEPETGHWSVEVADTGIGMSAEQCERVFQRFEQADDSTTRRFGGTGLGLYISRQLARQLGGELSATSTPGAGSRFLLRLPIGLSPRWVEEGADFHREEAPPPAAAPALRGRVLVVDDVEDLRLLLRGWVEATGAEVIEAGNGAEACDRLRTGPVDLVLMDMHMPVMDGPQAVATLRAEGFHLPIYACSADVLPEEVERFIALGCDGALAKPLDRAALHQVLARHLAAAAPATPAGDPMAAALQAIRARFVAAAPAEREALAAAGAAGDRAVLKKLAHRLKGSAGTFGFAEVAAAAAALEAVLEAGPEEVRARLQTLDARLSDLH